MGYVIDTVVSLLVGAALSALFLKKIATTILTVLGRIEAKLEAILAGFGSSVSAAQKKL